jgi:hypothetical protein
MKRILTFLILTVSFINGSFAQDNAIRPAALGISFFFNDFTTPQRIRTGSLSQVLREDKWAKFREMDPGFAVTYFQGLQKYIDFAGTLSFSFPSLSLANESNSANSSLLLEGDASFNFKLLPEKYWVTPYAIAGVGASKYKSTYGALIPLGIGFKVNFFDEASLFISSQYRVPVTSGTNNYHFMTNIGIAGVIGKKKQVELKQEN